VAQALPTGAVTFLLTDIESSTRLWEQHPSVMPAVVTRHDALIEGVVAAQAGLLVRPRGEGDSRFAVFAQASAAVAAAAAIQLALLEEPWALSEQLRVHMALHSGKADVRQGG
jgi:class 3 adenylate cyclase